MQKKRTKEDTLNEQTEEEGEEEEENIREGKEVPTKPTKLEKVV